MAPDRIRIGIVYAHNVVRKALKNWISLSNSFDVSLEAADRKELFIKLSGDSSLDVLILDFSMPETEGKEYLQQLRQRYPHIRVVIISMYLDHLTIIELLNMGVYGYLFKGSDISELEEAIREASMNRIYQNKILTEALYQETEYALQYKTISQQNGGFNPKLFLTDKQIKILRLIWEEKNTQEISEAIFLSVSAVDKIKQQLKEKTGAKTTIGLIKYAIETRIIEPVALA